MFKLLYLRNRLYSQFFLKNEEGSFTIEASLVFPIVVITTMALLFFSLFIYENVFMYYRSSVAADRAAFAWNNSHRDFATGEIKINSLNQLDGNDGLYWRMLGDIPGGQLPQQKMQHALSSIKYSGTSSTNYNNTLIQRKVKIGMEKPVTFSQFFPGMYGKDNKIMACASTTITDPVEFIRTFDLLYYYVPIIKGSINANKKSNVGKFVNNQ